MQMKSKENGVTLTSLVVTIIILIILAGVSIGTLTGDNGIIKQAGNAKEQTEIASEKEIIEIAVIQAMEKNKNGDIEKTDLEKYLNNSVKEGATEIKEDDDGFIVGFFESDRYYYIDKNGNVRKVTWWNTSDDEGNNKITNGKIELNVGDYINYSPNSNGEITYVSYATETGIGENQEFSTNIDTNGWRLLGIEYSDLEDYLLIIPANPIQTISQENYSLKGQVGYQYGVNEIEKICGIYGNGIGATDSRALKIEDINKITGYNPLNTGDETVFKEGEIGEYKNEVTYTKNSNLTIEVLGKNGVNATYNYPAFNYFDKDNNEWKKLNIGESTNIINTCYYYYPTTLTNNSSDVQKGISSNSKEYSMLFSNDKSYWLASSYEGGFDTYITCTWGIFNVRWRKSLWCYR